jgi:hypothetical protein
MLSQEQTKEIDVHLAEYQTLRSEVNLSNQRIDRIVGFYLTALFAIFAYFLRPESTFDIGKYLTALQANYTLTGFLLILPILNSILLMRLATFFLSILAMAKYLLYVVAPRLDVLLESNVLGWDRLHAIDAKGPWLTIRSIAQLFFFLLSEGVSFGILACMLHVFRNKPLLIALYGISCFTVLASLISASTVFYVGINFHKSLPAAKPYHDSSPQHPISAKMMTGTPKLKLKLLMQSLFYPAVLGATLVLFLNKIANHKNAITAACDITNYFGLFLIIFFSVMYLELYLTPTSVYPLMAFCLDITEIIIIFLAFYALGFFDPNLSTKPDLHKFYFYVLPAPILENLWNWAIGDSTKPFWGLVFLTTAVLAFGALFGARYLLFNIFALVVCSAILVYYLLKLNDPIIT